MKKNIGNNKTYIKKKKNEKKREKKRKTKKKEKKKVNAASI